MFKVIFVTVGTTKFDRLVQLFDDAEIQNMLTTRLGATKLVIQCGKSVVRPSSMIMTVLMSLAALLGKVDALKIDCYDYKPHLRDDIESADLVISHCGAGTILEILHARKTAIGVINQDLLDNHQVELADKMEQEHYMAIARSPENLREVLNSMDQYHIQDYGDPNPELFLGEVSRLVRFP